MLLYHGTDNPTLEVKPHIRSRYGIPCFFGTPSAALAMQYASKRNRLGVGYLYHFQINKPRKTIDWKHANTYTTDGAFRNLIYSLYKEGHKSVLIKNAIDYPDTRYKNHSSNEIVVIYDLKLIENMERIN